MLTRKGPKGRIFVPWHEIGKGIAMTNRPAFPDREKRRQRVHVGTEAEAADKLKKGYHLWMVPADAPQEREVLICPASVEGWH